MLEELKLTETELWAITFVQSASRKRFPSHVCQTTSNSESDTYFSLLGAYDVHFLRIGSLGFQAGIFCVLLGGARNCIWQRRETWEGGKWKCHISQDSKGFWWRVRRKRPGCTLKEKLGSRKQYSCPGLGWVEMSVQSLTKELLWSFWVGSDQRNKTGSSPAGALWSS